MSFRWYVYCCALYGGWAAFAGWALGRMFSPASRVGEAALKGLLLGALVAAGLKLLEYLGSLTARGRRVLALRLTVASAVGCAGGLAGGALGQCLYEWTEAPAAFVLGWAITGLLVGASVAAFDVFGALLRRQTLRGRLSRLRNGAFGGVLGGGVGGALALLLKQLGAGVFDKPADELWSPSALGLVSLGSCTGLAAGLVQVILKEAWLRVEAGFRPGRELLLSADEVTLGRAESCDVGLYGDAQVARVHARVRREGDGYVLVDAGSEGGTFLNGRRVTEPTTLHSGDRIRLGQSVLQFGERVKRGEGPPTGPAGPRGVTS